MGVDLGTYYVEVRLKNGDGWIQEWATGRRFTDGSDAWSPLDAKEIVPAWETEPELLSTMKYMYLDGNYSCDCNKRLFLDYAHQNDPPDLLDYDCGDELEIESITVIRPNGERVVLI